MRVAKIVLAAAAAVVALVIIAVIVVASTFDPNDYKSTVTDAFTARTGRALVIDQDLRLAYFPWLAVTTGGITIGSSADFGGATAPFATAARVEARVRLLPLLAGRFEVGTVVIDGLMLNLARDASSRGNWQDLVDAANAAAPPEPAAPAVSTAQGFAIAGIRVRDGSVYWRENTSELRYSVTGFSLTTGPIGAGEPIAFETALEVKDELSGLAAGLDVRAVVTAPADGPVTAMDVAANVSVRTGGGDAPRKFALTARRLAFDRERQALEVDALATEAAGVRATWQLAGTALIDNPAFEGSVAVDRADLRAALGQIGLSPPSSVDASELGTLSLTTRFSYRTEPPLVGLSELQAEALGMTVLGGGSLEGNELEGTIEIPEFAPSAAGRAWLRAAVPPRVDVSALDRLAFKSRFDANLESGRAALRGFNATVFGATFMIDLEALPGERGNVFRASVTTSRFDSGALVKAFAAMLPPNLAASELGTVAIDARFLLDGATDTLTVAPFDAEMFGLTASGEVTARNVSTAATWTGSARVGEFSPQDLLRRFGLPPQPTSDPAAFEHATLVTRFGATKDGAELHELTLTIDDTKVTGRFALEGFERPAYRFDLDVDRVDADRYLPPKARDADTGEQTAGDIELPQNNTMDLDGTMRVGALKIAGMEFQDVGTRIVIGNGDLKLEQARARLYGGTFDGGFAVHAAGDAPGLALEGRAAGIEIEPLVTAFTGEQSSLSGTGSFDLKLAGSGRTIRENSETAAGDVRFDMANGAIRGFNLGYTLCRLYNVTQRAPSPPPQPAATPFQMIKGTAVVRAGTAVSDDLLARTSFMDIDGNGTLRLAEQEMDYELDATLTGSIGIANCETLDRFVGDSLPFEIEGTVTEPDISPDFSKLVLGEIGDEIKDRLQDRLRDRLRDLLDD